MIIDDKGDQMIIKSTDKLISREFGVVPTPAKVNNNNEDRGCELATFDASAASILLSVLECYDLEDFGAAFKTPDETLDNMVSDECEVCSKTASVKFMITMQDEKCLRNLGYSQSQIDKIKPQEAADILMAGTKANHAE